MVPEVHKGVRAWAVALFALAAAQDAFAHEYWPAYLELRETAAERYDVSFKVPTPGGLRLPVYARLPERCRATEAVRVFNDDTMHLERWGVHCQEGLAGASLGVDGLDIVYADSLVRIERLDGSGQVFRLTPDEPEAVVDDATSGAQVALSYFGLGVEHILLGIDHLLFVLALVIITRGIWRLVATITAFTAAHSITLGLATLGVVHVPSAPVEAVIALSIVFVAAEIVRGYRGGSGLTARAPWIVAFVFGLLHGFGFAGALSEVGLPHRAIPLALLFFNLGVEAGQLVFVVAVLALRVLLQRSALQVPRWTELVPAYAIGGVAMMWVIERVTSFTGS
jgi:hydrogenase/urease accessory protein HupE